ncbi:uncharacterized protein LOC106161196 [Lingula anatina]|uniref:Uncharacterized protein LOC106161196 n=1 Tax=Lingula anatina TaxID=7574 RepID=A0A1S3I5K1_LINAN|nr:uncharacterized protein LOC106161196 [Lingula anatina]|eukprot:XP_013393532.1 uncharacterized protein LOC106161196 [Lingula anatina]
MSSYMLIVLVVIWSSCVLQTEAACCRATKGYCKDCTSGTPYCGYRRCNIFGCNCGGGCRYRSGCYLSKHWGRTTCHCGWYGKRSIELDDKNEETASPQSSFSALDKDGNGYLDLNEFGQAIKGSKGKVDADTIQRKFAEMDDNKDKRISPGEFDTDLASPNDEGEIEKEVAV